MKTQLDAGEPAWYALTQAQKDEICQWLADNGINHEITHSVRLLSEGQIEVEMCDRYGVMSMRGKCSGIHQWVQVHSTEPTTGSMALLRGG